MKKFLLTLLSLIIASHVMIMAKKPHYKSHGRHAYSSRAYKKKRVRVDNRPEMTINDVKDTGNPWGIDISHYQSDIDWNTLQIEKPHFMFIKASEGIDLKDHKYDVYYSEAKKIGIPVGSYHFFSYKSSGKDQAENFLSVAQHQTGDLLPVLDAEYIRKMPKDRQKITEELTNFVNTVYERLGFYPIIYCSYRYCQTYLTEAIQKKCKLWIVDYKNKPNGNWTLWQATNKFKLSSIKGHVDLNIFNGSIHAMKDIFFQKSPDINLQKADYYF
jgi:lysozyme